MRFFEKTCGDENVETLSILSINVFVRNIFGNFDAYPVLLDASDWFSDLRLFCAARTTASARRRLVPATSSNEKNRRRSFDGEPAANSPLTAELIPAEKGCEKCKAR